MKLPTLYGKSSAGKLLLWEVFTEDEKIVVRHGQLGSDKIQEKVTIAKGKNIGKSNETTPEEQADLEAKSKWTKQKKKGYYESKEEAVGHIEWHPMKLQDFKDQGHKIEYPCYYQPKLDGQRIMVDAEGCVISKQGEILQLPTHIALDLIRLISSMKNSYEFKGFDGEIYAGLESAGGLSLQRIISAFRKENEDTPKLKYYVYDIPSANEPFETRKHRLDIFDSLIHQNAIKNIVIVPTEMALGKEQLQERIDEYVTAGYEGGVARNRKGIYEFGKRSYDAQKLKPRTTTEAKVLLVEKDKNRQGVLQCQLSNGVSFKCLMRKDADTDVNLRDYNNSLTLVGKWITVEFESLSDSGVPGKPVGIAVREVNSLTWEGK